MIKENYIYVVFVRSNTNSGKVIRKITGWNYSHISISFDEKLTKFYAFSRTNYKSSYASFTEEQKSNYTLLKKENASITIYKIPINEKEKRKITEFIEEMKTDKEYIFNYPSMITTKFIHGILLYKSYNCITFVTKILSYIKEVNLTKDYYKYDLNEVEEELKNFYYKTEEFKITSLKEKNSFFNKINFLSRKKMEMKLYYECIYRLIFKKSSRLYDKEKYEGKIKNKSKKTFNILAKKYDKSLTGHNPRKNYSLILDKISLNENEALIDIGCGTGEILNNLAKKYPKSKLYGLDISQNMLSVAKSKTMANKIEYILGDSESIPFKDNKFDILITSESFHHYPNPSSVIKEFNRVLKPNGLLILCDMYRPLIIRNIMNFAFHFTNTGDVKIYNKKRILKLLEKDFKNIKYKNYYSSFICEAKNNK